MKMKQGEIYKLNDEYKTKYKDGYKHNFIYWNEEDKDYRGIMLTALDKTEYGNRLMKEEHFKKGFKFKYGKSDSKPTHIAPLFLLKKVPYNELEKTGELSDKGIEFIKGIISELEYTDWKTHMKKIRNSHKK